MTHSNAHSVAVAIPIYRSTLTPDEHTSLASIVDVLGRRRPLVVVRPRGLDLSQLEARFPQLTFEDFDPEFFDGIRGYNRLMTSADFYRRFSDYEYVLIAQLDAYIFSDDLDRWCAAGYDYVGAPWLQRPLNKLWPIKWLKTISGRRNERNSWYDKTKLYNRVGNGGLSLRRVETHVRACERYASDLAMLNTRGRKGWPEDVFWALTPEGFRYPTAMEALAFSFDKYPRYCLRLNGGRLPMGCHGWTSRKMRAFWKNFIPTAK